MTATAVTKSGRVRDSQRQRLYDAEVREMVWPGRKQMALAECQDYVNRLCAQAWTQRRWRYLTPPRVGDGRGSPRARYVHWKNTIEVPPWARDEWMLLHEMAHYLAQRCRTSCTGGPGHCSFEAPHGWHFAAIYLMLVRHQLGRATHDALRAAFKAGRVRYTRPRL